MKLLTLPVLLAFVLCGTANIRAGNALDPTLPGIVRSTNSIYLMEDHSASLIVWHALGITNGTLVHVDTHDDCRMVTADKLTKLAELLKTSNYKEISRRSHTLSMLDFEVKEDDFLYDLGNFIYPCLMDGTVTNVYWVIPEIDLPDSRNQKLLAHMTKALALKSEDISVFTGGFVARVGKGALTVTTLNKLPQLEKGALLDIDTDFFVFSSALSETHVAGDLPWDPATVLNLLSKQAPKPAVVTISSSVWGGYLPTMFRFLSDGCFDYFASGKYPKEANDLLGIVTIMRTTSTTPEIPSQSPNSPYRPAWEYLQAMTAMIGTNQAKAAEHIVAATQLNPVYCKAMLDFSEAYLFTGNTNSAMEMLNLFEKTRGRETYNSIAIRTRLLLETGNLDEAQRLADKLAAWTGGPFTMMLKAGVLEKRGKLDEALAIYSEILGTTPGNALALYNTGVVMQKQNKTKEAIAQYRNAINQNPDLFQAYDNLGYLLVALNENEEAVPILTSALRLNPLATAARTRLGQTLAKLGRHAEAIHQFKQALTLSSDKAAIHLYIAASMLELKNKNEAIKSCMQALQIKPYWQDASNLIQRIREQKTH